MNNKRRAQIVLGVILLILLIDQALKFYIKTHFYLSESVDIFGLSWAKFLFIENKGMAFGITFGEKCLGKTVDGECNGLILSNDTGKLVLSLFRFVLIGFLLYLMRSLIRSKESIGLLISFALIIAGAIGNLIDSAFYGLIFSASEYHGPVAQLFPPEGGYAPFMHGKVVDMFYFPLINGTWPQWFPMFGGESFQFFRPIFNVADSSIFIGVTLILLFYRQLFAQPKKEEKTESKT